MYLFLFNGKVVEKECNLNDSPFQIFGQTLMAECQGHSYGYLQLSVQPKESG